MKQRIACTINGRIPTINAQILLVFFALCFFPLVSQASGLPKPRETQVSTKKSATIKQFIRYIWQTNPAIQAAQSEVDRADAGFSQSRRPIYNPSLELDAEHVRKEPFEDTYTAGISQTIDLFNKRRARTVVGQHSLTESKANLSTQQLILATKTLQGLVKYRTTQEVVKLAKRRTKLLRRFKEQSTRKFRSGDITQSAVDQASLAYAEAISQQADAEIAKTRARQNLVATSQIDSRHWPHLPSRLPKPLNPSPPTRQKWLKKLPILKVYSARVAAAKARERVAQSEAKPDLTIGLRAGTEDKELLVGGTISMPLFVRNNFQDRVRAVGYQAIAEEQIRMNIYQEVKETLLGDLSRYQILYDSIINWRHVTKHSLYGGVDLLDRLWLAGELSTTDYLLQLKQRIDSQISGIKLSGKAWKMWFSLMESSGQLDTWLAKT